MSKPHLIIVRGSCGSGKTTYASQWSKVNGYEHFENDSFFVNNDSEYHFNFAFHQEAKDWCLNKTKEAIADNKNVVVSNTFILLKDINPYLCLNAKIKVVEMFLHFENTHQVPESVVQEMNKDFEHYIGAEQIYNTDYIIPQLKTKIKKMKL